MNKFPVSYRISFSNSVDHLFKGCGWGWLFSLNPFLTAASDRQGSFGKAKSWVKLISTLVDTVSKARAGHLSLRNQGVLIIPNSLLLTAGSVSWPDIFFSFLLFMLFFYLGMLGQKPNLQELQISLLWSLVLINTIIIGQMLKYKVL